MTTPRSREENRAVREQGRLLGPGFVVVAAGVGVVTAVVLHGVLGPALDDAVLMPDLLALVGALVVVAALHEVVRRR